MNLFAVMRLNVSELKTGSIYLVKYREYKQDPNPLILVLYPGTMANFNTAKPEELMHAINLNYLQAGMAKDVYRLVAMVATKQLSASKMYKLYHEYIKYNLSSAIRNAYRTYHPNKIIHPKLVSSGFKESLTLVNKLSISIQRKEEKIIDLVKAKVEATKHIANVTKKVASQGLNTGLSLEEAERRARLYIDAINKARRPEEIDLAKYTLLLGRKR